MTNARDPTSLCQGGLPEEADGGGGLQEIVTVFATHAHALWDAVDLRAARSSGRGESCGNKTGPAMGKLRRGGSGWPPWLERVGLGAGKSGAECRCEGVCGLLGEYVWCSQWGQAPGGRKLDRPGGEMPTPGPFTATPGHPPSARPGGRTLQNTLSLSSCPFRTYSPRRQPCSLG